MIKINRISKSPAQPKIEPRMLSLQVYYNYCMCIDYVMYNITVTPFIFETRKTEMSTIITLNLLLFYSSLLTSGGEEILRIDDVDGYHKLAQSSAKIIYVERFLETQFWTLLPL